MMLGNLSVIVPTREHLKGQEKQILYLEVVVHNLSVGVKNKNEKNVFSTTKLLTYLFNSI